MDSMGVDRLPGSLYLNLRNHQQMSSWKRVLLWSFCNLMGIICRCLPRWKGMIGPS